MENKGYLSIENNNIFSILKKGLYTEKDIVFRELISNASDAIEKLGTLEKKDNADYGYSDKKIQVTLNENNKTLIISDNGIGMTEEDISKYINQIAFSGAADFIEKHNNTDNNSIIGHFGVGFYSAFMLADHVAIETKSYENGSPAVRWDCNSDMSYSMSLGSRKKHGTDIIIHLNEETDYITNPSLIYDAIKKYFLFLDTKIFLNAPNYDNTIVNELEPIWRDNSSQLTSEKINTFYKNIFKESSDPIYWIRFESVDIGIRGIIFFRDTKNGTEELDGTFKVYNKGVFVGDNIRDMIPKFINLQNGIVECDDLPLVVSRSSIQEVDNKSHLLKLIYETLSQEVTIALNNLYEKKRETYEKFWPQLNAFVKYGILQDNIFASVMMKKVIYEDIYGKFFTIKEYLEIQGKDHEGVVYYASDKLDQAHYIEIFRKCNLNALLFDHVIDQPFMRRYELVHTSTKFIRIDSNIEAFFSGTDTKEDDSKIDILSKKIIKHLGTRLGDTGLRITKLKYENISSLILNDEHSRRMMDLMEIYGLIQGVDVSNKKTGSGSTLIINLNNEIIKYVLESTDDLISGLIVNQLYDLALMSQGALDISEVEPFLSRSEDLLKSLIRK